MDNEKFGQFVRSMRKEKQMTQQQLADRLHLTDKAVSKWERGLSLPDISMFYMEKPRLILRWTVFLRAVRLRTIPVNFRLL